MDRRNVFPSPQSSNRGSTLETMILFRPFSNRRYFASLWIPLLMAHEGTPCFGVERDEVVRQAFLATHDGWSSDEVLLRDDLNQAFLLACREQLPEVKNRDFNWTLLNLRKAKKLGGEVTRRKPGRHDSYRHAAEIAARRLEDRHRQNIDRVLCDPALREEFDAAARALAPQTPAYLLRKAALSLRKAHQLKPELVVRVADWGRTVQSFSLTDLQRDLTRAPNRPGIYMFFDASGYLYIGEAADLRARLTHHLRDSDRPTLAKYLAEQAKEGGQVSIEIHAFESESAASRASMRRAYESELIRSRKPRFNVRLS